MTLNVLKEYIEAEFENIRETAERIESIQSSRSDQPSDIEVAALSVYIHNIYNGFENILKLVCSFQGRKIQKTPHWHRELLNVSRDNGVINLELWANLDKFLSFRHHLVHSYVFKIEWLAIKNLVDAVQPVTVEFERQLIEYLDCFSKVY
ncbi:MAG: hypothetical protein HY877_01600 [Deltaproteobacteria bacterium]|nr:hypothetical protein [Deltaproteobacteria bacterium]